MKLAAALLAALVLAPAARAEATIVSRDLPLPGRGARSPAAAAPARFDLVGLHWRGPGSVELRTRRVGGGWTVWRPAAPEDEDRPDRASDERARPGWRLGNPYWVGRSDRIEIRVRGRVVRVRGHFVSSSAGREPPRRLSLASSPLIVPRASWQANELIKRGTPRYAPSLGFAVVHHTAGSNAYTREQSAAIVRGIQLYHVRANGWNDIGYNFLVDKYGQVFEGRFGGVERNVVGAHAEGFNTGSTGVAVIGNYGSGALSAAARDALVRLLAWRLDVAHVDPLSTLTWASGGNARFPAGRAVFLRAIVGHRDTGFTACPGDALYRLLDGFAAAVAATGLPKLYAPAARGGPGGPVRFTARLSGPLPWAVTVTDAAGQPVATGAGTGELVDWTWDATLAAPGHYAWSIGAGPTVRPATGTIGGTAAPLAITGAGAAPPAFTPNGDGRDDATTVSYTLGAAANVTATLTTTDGTTLATLFSEPKAAGPQSFLFTGEGVPDGTYRILLTAVAGGRTATAVVEVLVNRTLSGLAASRVAVSPNGDGRADSLGLAFSLAVPAEVKLRVLRLGKWVATPFAGPLGPGPQALSWDGSKRIGRALDGAYEVELSVTDAVGTVAQRVPFTVDTRRPSLKLLSLRPLRVRVSEAAEIVAVVDDRRVVVKAAGAGVVRLAAGARRLRARAWDPAGNVSPPLRAP